MPIRRILPLLGAALLLLVLALLARLVTAEVQNHQRAKLAEHLVGDLRVALQAAEMVSRERGPTNGALGEGLPARAEVVAALKQARDRTDSALQALHSTLRTELTDALELGGPDAVHTQQVQAVSRQFDTAMASLQRARGAVDELRQRPLPERGAADLRNAVAGMVAVVPQLAPAVGQLANDVQQALPDVGGVVQGARLVAELREYAGLLGSHFTAPLVRGQPFTAEERDTIGRTRGRIDQLRYLIALQVDVPGQRPDVLKAWERAEAHYFTVAMQLVGEVLAAGETDGRYGLDPRTFAARYVPDMNTLFALRDALLEEAAGRAREERGAAVGSLLATAVGLALLLGVMVLGMLVVYRRVLVPLAGVSVALDAMARNDLAAPLPQPRAQDEMAAVIGGVATLQQRSRERAVLEAERDSLIEQLRAQSSTDFLTGLPNRRAYFEAAQQQLALARRRGEPVVAILLDVDHFKQFNDRHGHSAGDQALREVAQALRRSLRAGDLVARYGGEEFVLLLPGCDRVAGLAFAERLRLAISQVQLMVDDAADSAVAADGAGAAGARRAEAVSASLGLADSARYGLDLDALLSHADAAMYRAKALGRNRVVVAGERTDSEPAQ